MQIYIDSANINEIEEAASWGFVDGVTTNPTLVKRAYDTIEKKPPGGMEAYLRALIEKSPGPISLEITAVTADEMIRQGHYLNNLKPDKVVVKVPVNPATDGKPNNDGMRATSELEKEGIQVNVTLIMTPEQALLAAQAGASYVSPFAGRIDDYLRTEKLKMESPEFTDRKSVV